MGDSFRVTSQLDGTLGSFDGFGDADAFARRVSMERGECVRLIAFDGGRFSYCFTYGYTPGFGLWMHRQA